MSWISNIFKTLGSFFNTSAGGSVLGIGSSLLGGLFTSNQNRKLMREQNEFNAEQADINRQFQSKEAEIARDWQERFYQQYQSPQAMVHQYEQAGINPVLAAGHATNTPPAATSSSGSMAQGVSPGYQSVAGIMEQFGKLALLKAEIENVGSDSDLKRAQAFAAERAGLASNSQSALNFSQVKLNNQKVSESMSVVSNLIEQTNSEKLRQGLIIAEKVLRKNESANLAYDILKKQYDETFKEKYGFYPDSSIVKSSLGILNETVRNIEYGIDKTVNFVKNKYNEWF